MDCHSISHNLSSWSSSLFVSSVILKSFFFAWFNCFDLDFTSALSSGFLFCKADSSISLEYPLKQLDLPSSQAALGPHNQQHNCLRSRKCDIIGFIDCTHLKTSTKKIKQNRSIMQLRVAWYPHKFRSNPILLSSWTWCFSSATGNYWDPSLLILDTYGQWHWIHTNNVPRCLFQFLQKMFILDFTVDTHV